jgi:hypothetical protein
VLVYGSRARVMSSSFLILAAPVRASAAEAHLPEAEALAVKQHPQWRQQTGDPGRR